MQLCPRCGIRWSDPALGTCAVCHARDAQTQPPQPAPAASWEMIPSAPPEPPKPPPPPPEAPTAPVPTTPAPLSLSLAVELPPDDEAPLSLTQVTGMGALGCHGVPERIPGTEVGALKLSPFEGYLLSLVDGATVSDDVVAASGLNVLDAAAAFKRLQQLGVLRFRSEKDDLAALRNADGSIKEREPESNVPVDHVVGQMGLRSLLSINVEPAADDPGEHLRLSQDAEARGDFGEARAQVRLAWVLAPDDPEVIARREQLESPAHAPARARRLEELGANAERAADALGAVQWYRRALQEHEPQPHLHHRLALVILQAGLPTGDARVHVERATQLAPENSGAAHLLQRLRALGS